VQQQETTEIKLGPGCGREKGAGNIMVNMRIYYEMDEGWRVEGGGA
jgi:hypothetical protein